MLFLQKLTIKRRLQINALLVAIAMLILLVVILFEANTMLRLNKTIQLAEEMNVYELKLRKHEKNFLFYKQVESLEAFESEYKSMLKNHSELQGLFNELQLDGSKLNNLLELVKQYKADFDMVVALQKEIGLHPKDAAYGRLRKAVHEVETLLKQQQNYPLLAAMLQLRRNEKDFMLRFDKKYLAKFEKNIAAFKVQLENQALNYNYATQLTQLLDTYQSEFSKLVQAQEKLGLDLNSGALGKLSESVKQSNRIINEMVDETEVLIEDSASFTKMIALIIFAAASIIVLSFVYFTSLSIIVPINRVCEVIHRIRGDNNLTLHVNRKSQDEIGLMTKDFDSLIDDFKDLVFEVNSALTTLNVATENLANTTSATSDGMREQLHEADMVATAATQMQATIQDISLNTEEAAKKAESTNESALAGKEEVDSTVSRISELSNSLGGASEVVSQLEKDGETIGSVLDVIRGIAEQTNLLALNAAIEAARAGEQGRGFAVVADEVRSLAQRTQDSTQEIESIISTLQSRTQEVVSLMDLCQRQGGESATQAQKAGELLQSITVDVQNIMDMSTQIATAIDEQNQVASEVNQNVVRIRDIAEEAAEHAATNADTSEQVSTQAGVLHNAIAKFKV